MGVLRAPTSAGTIHIAHAMANDATCAPAGKDRPPTDCARSCLLSPITNLTRGYRYLRCGRELILEADFLPATGFSSVSQVAASRHSHSFIYHPQLTPNLPSTMLRKIGFMLSGCPFRISILIQC